MIYFFILFINIHFIMNLIINPNTNKRYSLFSKQGKQILKNMVTSYIGGMYSEIDYDDYKLNKTKKVEMVVIFVII